MSVSILSYPQEDQKNLRETLVKRKFLCYRLSLVSESVSRIDRKPATGIASPAFPQIDIMSKTDGLAADASRLRYNRELPIFDLHSSNVITRLGVTRR